MSEQSQKNSALAIEVAEKVQGYMLAPGTCLTTEAISNALYESAIQMMIALKDETSKDYSARRTKEDQTPKPSLSLVLRFPTAMAGLANLLEYGEKKHGGFTAGKASADYKTIADSLLRHLTAVLNGEEMDKESGKAHRFHLLANAVFFAELLAPQVDILKPSKTSADDAYNPPMPCFLRAPLDYPACETCHAYDPCKKEKASPSIDQLKAAKKALDGRSPPLPSCFKDYPLKSRATAINRACDRCWAKGDCELQTRNEIEGNL